ncbi:PREDICTED: uncharacterized protein LOC106807641 [Priapulus caudatus]|uniref:Uncharacterized protein LOC106807641 n=1 Tax=Priapulus caudatus TaxID=37621 RepID=A0ABM1E016_PRICU|nr:PREDICTED: uncharacterized protein LOC106807641 [Priapulus caudatus]
MPGDGPVRQAEAEARCEQHPGGKGPRVSLGPQGPYHTGMDVSIQRIAGPALPPFTRDVRSRARPQELIEKFVPPAPLGDSVQPDAIVIAVSVVLSVLVLVVVGITCVVWSRCPLYKMCRVRYGADSEISYSAEKTDESKVKMKMMKPLCPENGAAADTEPKCAAAAANRPESPVEDCSGAAAALVDAGGGPEQA